MRQNWYNFIFLTFSFAKKILRALSSSNKTSSQIRRQKRLAVSLAVPSENEGHSFAGRRQRQGERIATTCHFLLNSQNGSKASHKKHTASHNKQQHLIERATDAATNTSVWCRSGRHSLCCMLNRLHYLSFYT